ncbi:MAG: tetratricopeptide repeat protein [Alphaproteobacteria bacterium]|nr:tetratricopeptide repeat protein [Alphaproteobacteria bacterium]
MKLMVLLFAMTALVSAGAQAQIIVSEGSGAAQDCFRHARFGYDAAAGIRDCTVALGQSLSAGDRAATYDNRGIILNRQGRSDEAASDFSRAIALRPDLGDPYINKGSVLIKQRAYEEALAEINKGMALGASFPQIGYYDRALALELLGRYKEAYGDYKKALEIEPGFTLASERLKDFVVTPARQKS